MGQTERFRETLRRLAMIDEGFVEDEASLGLGPAVTWALDPKTVALLRVGAAVASGSSAVCLEWSAGRALAAGASQDEIADVLLAIIPVAGLARVVPAAPELAAALGYDLWAALEEPDDHLHTCRSAPKLVTAPGPRLSRAAFRPKGPGDPAITCRAGRGRAPA